MTTMIEAPTCPRCQRRGLMSPNQDGDLLCLCGHVVYVTPALPIVRVDALADRQAQLSPRLLQTLRLVAADKTNREIAEALGVVQYVAERYVRFIKERLGIETREGLKSYAAHLPTYLDRADDGCTR